MDRGPDEQLPRVGKPLKGRPGSGAISKDNPTIQPRFLPSISLLLLGYTKFPETMAKKKKKTTRK